MSTVVKDKEEDNPDGSQWGVEEERRRHEYNSLLTNRFMLIPRVLEEFRSTDRCVSPLVSVRGRNMVDWSKVSAKPNCR
jgi:hypothetical protein